MYYSMANEDIEKVEPKKGAQKGVVYTLGYKNGQYWVVSERCALNECDTQPSRDGDGCACPLP